MLQQPEVSRGTGYLLLQKIGRYTAMIHLTLADMNVVLHLV